jgi:hypothetical protein
LDGHNPEKNSQSNSSHSCGSDEQHSENSRFYRTLDYYNSKIVNGILYLKKSKPPERDKKDYR